MSDGRAGWSEFREGECWDSDCTDPPDGLLLNGVGLRVAVCEEHGGEGVEDGNWKHYEDLRGWVDRDVPDEESPED